MTEERKKAFLQAPLRAREKILAQAGPGQPTQAERLADLESAVAGLAAAVPKGKTAPVAKVVANMVRMQSITLQDVPATLKEEVDQFLNGRKTEKNPKKEETR